jgi:hypothetical protein
MFMSRYPSSGCFGNGATMPRENNTDHAEAFYGQSQQANLQMQPA